MALLALGGGHHTPKDFDAALERIGRALKARKEVVLLIEGKPHSISLVDGHIKIIEIKNFEVEL